MAGTLLAPDQIRRLNAAFPALVNHLRTLLAADHTGYGLMRVHSQIESFDSDEMVAIFQQINFVTPKEKLALVRAAIFELMAAEPELFVSPVFAQKVVTAAAPEAPEAPKGPVAPAVFTPNFKLNIATSNAAEAAKTDTTPTPPPPTSTKPVAQNAPTATVSDRIAAGNKEQKAQSEKVLAAVAKLRAESSSPVVADAPVDHDALAEAMKLADETPEAPAAPKE